MVLMFGSSRLRLEGVAATVLVTSFRVRESDRAANAGHGLFAGVGMRLFGEKCNPSACSYHGGPIDNLSSLEARHGLVQVLGSILTDLLQLFTCRVFQV